MCVFIKRLWGSLLWGALLWGALLAAAATVFGPATAEASQWLDDYGLALQRTREANKPLLVVLEDRPARSPVASSSVAQLLRGYTLCRIDVTSSYGQEVAQVFNVKQFPYTTIIEPTGQMQVFRQTGRLSEEQLAQALVAFQKPSSPFPQPGSTQTVSTRRPSTRAQATQTPEIQTRSTNRVTRRASAPAARQKGLAATTAKGTVAQASRSIAGSAKVSFASFRQATSDPTAGGFVSDHSAKHRLATHRLATHRLSKSRLVKRSYYPSFSDSPAYWYYPEGCLGYISYSCYRPCYSYCYVPCYSSSYCYTPCYSYCYAPVSVYCYSPCYSYCYVPCYSYYSGCYFPESYYHPFYCGW